VHTPLPQQLTAISAAIPDTEYTSNTLVITGIIGTMNAIVTGGSATLVKNGNDTVAVTTSVVSGDTLAVKTRSAPLEGEVVKLSLQLGDKVLP
jgi:hypothetical protein